MAMQNICKLFPLIRNNVLRGGRKGLNAQENLIRLRNYGSVVLNDRNNLMLFQGHYRNILNDTATLVAISEHSKNPFGLTAHLKNLNILSCSVIQTEAIKNSKLPTYTRLEKMHGELLMLLKRLLQGDDVHSGNFLSTRGSGLLELNLSTEKRVRHKRISTTLRKGACDASKCWKCLEENTAVNG